VHLRPIARRVDLFPATLFCLAYDRLMEGCAQRADRDYVRLLHLAASTWESEVETLVHPPHSSKVLTLSLPDLDLSPYDNLIPSRRTHA
jgi:hypothetical protein